MGGLDHHRPCRPFDRSWDQTVPTDAERKGTAYRGIHRLYLCVPNKLNFLLPSRRSQPLDGLRPASQMAPGPFHYRTYLDAHVFPKSNPSFKTVVLVRSLPWANEQARSRQSPLACCRPWVSSSPFLLRSPQARFGLTPKRPKRKSIARLAR